jgi:hypothetical protein
MVDVLRKLVAHCRANVIVAFALMTVRSGEALDVRNGLDVPNDDMGMSNA